MIIKRFVQFINESSISEFNGFVIKLERDGDFANAYIYKDEDVIGMVKIDMGDTDPYVCHSSIDSKYQGHGLGRYVYDLLEDYLNMKLTHGDIASSISAIKLWRKKLVDPNYLPNNFHEYWGDDADEIIAQLNMQF